MHLAMNMLRQHWWRRLVNQVGKRIRQLRGRPFLRNMAVVAGGMAASQTIAMAFSPIISRLYGPEAYGVQGIFMSIASAIAAVAAMTYPTAIVLPEGDADAFSLARISLVVGAATSLLTALVIFLFGREILTLLNAQALLPFMYLVPAFMLVSVVSTVLNQWLIRKRNFVLTAKANLWQTLVVNVSKAGIGLAYPTAGTLAIINTLSGLFGSVMMLAGLRSARLRAGEGQLRRTPQETPDVIRRIWKLARQHRDFPFFYAPQVLLNALSHSLPAILLAGQFGPASVGYYALASAVLAAPASLLGGSVMQVFYPRVTDAINHGENARGLIIRATFWLMLSCAPICLTIILAGPAIFSFVFGAQWHTAGVYAQWLAVWICFQYVNKPAICAIPGLKLQRGLLFYELFSTASKVIALYLGFVYFRDDVASVALFSICGVVAYSWLILWVIYRSGKLKPIAAKA